MEHEFDKEIDMLLRKAHRDAPVLVGDFASTRHLDADEISAFAENAMPEKSRALYSAHLADCDRCRKILSNLLMMNAEAVPAAASPAVITIAERTAEPWYKKLFLFPNLAYVMGSLVLLFAGFLGYTVIQNSGGSDKAMVAQAPESSVIQGGPNAENEPVYADSFAANSANMSANSASNTASLETRSAVANANASGATGSTVAANTQVGGARGSENNFTLDGVAAAPPPPVAMAQPAPKDSDRERDDAKAKVEEKSITGAGLADTTKTDSVSKQQYSNLPSQSGPMRNNESQYNRQLENLDRRAAAKKAARSEDESSSARKVVSGKTFERKQGVWYDTSYQGRPTINVRRGTDEYNRLDSGLRSIANSIGGTVVVVWGAKAYRIQ